jgi:16S rRNA (cytidine1402-2'-O)-methyltransferase
MDKQSMEPSASGVLYVVATPIGNIKDISYRAVEILAAVDTIAAEDTRHSAVLLQQYSIHTPCIAVHEHNERQVASRIIEQIRSGQNVALISDAGTPLISDPGYFLVKEAREHNIRIIPIPGPSAFTAALSVSGLPSDRFVFEGFLPSKAGARSKRLQQLQTETRTLIFYEAPHRVAECLRDMATVMGADRPAVLAREITKTFETIRLAPLAELAEWVTEDGNQQRGEIVILVHGAEQQPQASDSDIDQLLSVLLEDMPTKQAATTAAKITGHKKKALYERALQLQHKK